MRETSLLSVFLATVLSQNTKEINWVVSNSILPSPVTFRFACVNYGAELDRASMSVNRSRISDNVQNCSSVGESSEYHGLCEKCLIEYVLAFLKTSHQITMKIQCSCFNVFPTSSRFLSYVYEHKHLGYAYIEKYGESQKVVFYILSEMQSDPTQKLKSYLGEMYVAYLLVYSIVLLRNNSPCSFSVLWFFIRDRGSSSSSDTYSPVKSWWCWPNVVLFFEDFTSKLCLLHKRNIYPFSGAWRSFISIKLIAWIHSFVTGTYSRSHESPKFFKSYIFEHWYCMERAMYPISDARSPFTLLRFVDVDRFICLTQEARITSTGSSQTGSLQFHREKIEHCRSIQEHWHGVAKRR